jgi:hypothetical protein
MRISENGPECVIWGKACQSLWSREFPATRSILAQYFDATGDPFCLLGLVFLIEKIHHKLRGSGRLVCPARAKRGGRQQS